MARVRAKTRKQAIRRMKKAVPIAFKSEEIHSAKKISPQFYEVLTRKKRRKK